MPLLNYTTTVPAGRTVQQIDALLAKSGARAVMKEYDAKGEVQGLSFMIAAPYGMQSYLLPVDAESVRKVLTADNVAPSYRTPEHARRVAWRILKDWIEAQLALVRARMVTLDQVMLPYAKTDNGRTVYQRFVEQRLALESGQNGDADE